MQDTKFSVERNGARGDGLFDNSEAIKRTINETLAVGGGVVSFPAGIWKTSGKHVLPSCTTIEGTGARDNSQCRIELVGDNGYVFKVGDLSRSVNFRDIELHAAKGSKNVGVLAEGTYDKSAFMTTFERVVTQDLDCGFEVRSLPGVSDWECNMLRLADCQFIGGTGIKCNTTNSQFVLDNCYFKPGIGKNALHLNKVGLLRMDGCLGVGETNDPCVDGKPDSNNAKTFIYLGGERGPVNIESCATEGMQEFLRVVIGSHVAAINLKGNLVQDRVVLENTTILESRGNQYCVMSVHAAGHSRIYSRGDMLYRLPNGKYVNDCDKEVDSRSPFACTEGALVMVSENPITAINEFQARHIYRDPGPAFYPPDQPIVAYESEVVEKPTARFGTRANYFETSRDWNVIDRFIANQRSPHKGFAFNGIIELEEEPGGQLPTQPGKIRIRVFEGKLQWGGHKGKWTDFK